MPRLAGSAVLFSHRVFHWGGAGRPGCPTPRIAISFAASDPAFEPHYLAQPDAAATAGAGKSKKGATPSSAFPSLAARLALAAAQVVCYHDRFVPMAGPDLKRYRALIAAAPGALAPADSPAVKAATAAQKAAT